MNKEERLKVYMYTNTAPESWEEIPSVESNFPKAIRDDVGIICSPIEE